MSQLFQAISCLFNPQSPQTDKKNANVFLETFSKTQQSWMECRQIIERTDIDAQIQFFCCNILYQKVRREWSVLPDSLQSEINGWLSNMLGSIATGKIQCYHLVTQRLSATLAASASLSSGGFTAVTNLSLQLLQSNTSAITINVTIQLLKALPQAFFEAAVTSRRRNKLEAELATQYPRVLDVISTLLTQQGSPSYLGGATDEKMCVSVLQCAKEWTRPSYDCSISLATLQSKNGLLSFLLQTFVSSEQITVIEAVSDLICASMKPESQWMSDSSPGDQSQEHATAVHTVMTAVLAARPKFLQASASWNPDTQQADGIESLCRSICRVATKIGEITCYVVARGQHEMHLQLVNFIMECTALPIRTVAIESEEFWNVLTEVPIIERHEQLRQPVFASLLSTIIRQCRFDGELDGFVGELDEIDGMDDRYGAFRQGAFDLLQNTYYLLRSQYFKVAVDTMTNGSNGFSNDSTATNSGSNGSNGSNGSGGSQPSSPSRNNKTVTWRDREAAMWSICSVARVFVQQQRQSIDQMKSSQKSQTGAVEPPTQIETEHCNQSSLILSQLLIGIASNPQAFSHPLLVRAVASTMEALASWIDSVAEAHPQIVQAVATYLVTSLRIPGASNSAAKGLQRVLNKCGRWMNNASMVAQLINEVNSSSNAMNPESRQNLVDGIATVVVKMNTHEEARTGLEALVGPVLERMEHALTIVQQGLQQQQQNNSNAMNERTENALQSISDELKTFATAMNHVDHFKTVSRIPRKQTQALQTVCGNVMSRAWPIITLIVSMSREETTNELFDLFTILLRSMTPLMGNYVASIVDAAVSTYRRSLSGAALKCLTGVVEGYGETHASALQQMLIATYEPTIACIQGGPSVLAARSETIREFFLLVQRVGVFSPSAFTQETLERVIPLATQCIVLNEFKPCKQVLLLLVLVLKLPQKSEELRRVTDQIMNNNDTGYTLAMTLLTCIATTSPSRLLLQHAEVLYCLAARYSNQCQQWIFQFLSNVPETTLKAETKQNVMTLLFDVQFAQNNLQRHKKRFKGVMIDLAKICRGEETAAVLAGWNMSEGGGGLIDLS